MGFTATEAVEVYRTGMTKIERRPRARPRREMTTTKIQ
jgi:hypothetical protein